jgi:hypothetical protein
MFVFDLGLGSGLQKLEPFKILKILIVNSLFLIPYFVGT